MSTRRTTRLCAKEPVGDDSDESVKKVEEDDDISSDFDTMKQTKRKSLKRLEESDNEGSSSDSSVGDYLKKADEIDLNSSFFTAEIVPNPSDFISVEKNILKGAQRLSESDDSEDETEKHEILVENSQSETKINFSQLRDYNKKIEETKACVEKYEKTKRQKKEKRQDIKKLLSLGEKNEPISVQSDFDDSDEDMDWQEIAEDVDKQTEKITIPKEGVQITVELPNAVKKKSKGFDMMAAIKRRINRVKKDNQIYVHKVHLLCWIAHGNYINSVLNSENLLGLALSLLPSDKCYPPKHADMSYLEQIVKWYGKMMKLQETAEDFAVSLSDALSSQISKKLAKSKTNFIYIFIIILRSLGLQCRLVLSFQCLPLRPPNSELCSLSTKDNKAKDEKEDKSKVKKVKNKPSTCTSKTDSKKKKVESKSPKTKTLRIPQLDGADDDDEPSTSKSKRNKPTIKIKLNTNLNDSTSSTDFLKPEFQLKPGEKNRKRYLTPDQSDHDFKPKRSSLEKSPNDIKGNKKSESKSVDKNKDKRRSRENKELHLKSKLENNLTSTEETIKNKNEKHVKGNLQESKSAGKNKNKSSAENNELHLKDKLENNLTSTQESTKKKNESVKRPTQKRNLKENVVKIVASKSADQNSKAHKKRAPSSKVQVKQKTPPTIARKSNVMTDIVSLIKGEMNFRREEEKSKIVRKPAKKPESDYDSDYFPDEDTEVPSTSQRRSVKKYDSADEFKFKVKRRVRPRSELESNYADATDLKRKGNDVWAEVFLEEEEKWISVDLGKGQVHCVSELHSRATQPVNYIIAWNNNLSLKDITARYCTNWNTVTRKLRVDPIWWNEALLPFQGIKTIRDNEEDEDLAKQQLDKPLPTVIGEYKNHPLYALERHLLKFEGIYPPNAMTLGFIRKEPVYARECVHTLHSREIWVKHAKVVKPKQQPYKIVKARPKYDRLTGNMINDLPLELFGKWQVEDYDPPTAENGVVPRNAYGNVELFKACMLPKKTVHLQLPGLNKVAKKLGIDCAPAVIGFDFHSGFSHPTFDGFVACEEFKDTLIAAWQEDREETSRKEQEKYDKRVWGNWRKLIKAVLIRERLKARYDFGKEEESKEKESASGGKKKAKGPSFVAKKKKL